MKKEKKKKVSSTTIWNHQFFGALPSLWSNCPIGTWLLGKNQTTSQKALLPNIIIWEAGRASTYDRGDHTNFQSITKFCLPLLNVSIAASKLLKQSLKWRAFCFSLILKASNPHTETFSPPLNGFYFFTSESYKLNAILSACISTQVSFDVSDLISGSIFRLFPLVQKRIKVY